LLKTRLLKIPALIVNSKKVRSNYTKHKVI